jgi:hypothetical protein
VGNLKRILGWGWGLGDWGSETWGFGGFNGLVCWGISVRFLGV